MTDQTRAREVLEFIGRQGKTPEQVREQFPDFDIAHLVRTGLVRLHRIELRETRSPGTPPAPDVAYYVLTRPGAVSVGIEPSTLYAA